MGIELSKSVQWYPTEHPRVCRILLLGGLAPPATSFGGPWPLPTLQTFCLQYSVFYSIGTEATLQSG